MLNKRKIPTRLDVLSRVLFQTLTLKQDPSTAYNLVADEIIFIWQTQRKRIQYLKEKKDIVQITKRLHQQYYGLLKSSKRTTETEIQKRNTFIAENSHEFDLSIMKRESVASASTSKNKSPNETAASMISSIVSSVGEDNASEFEPPPGKRTKRSKSFVYTNALIGAFDRGKVSNRRASLYVHTIGDSLNTNLDNLNVSYETIRRNRIKIRSIMDKEIREKFSDDSKNKKFVIHWDGKMLENLTNTEITTRNVHRLAIVLSCGKETKLLGIPKIRSGTGESQFFAVNSAIQDWGIKDRIIGMSFDNTSSNTSQQVGACVRLYNELNRNILWLSCRHHMYELVLKQIFYVVVERVTTSPNVAMFDTFKSRWPTLNQTIFEPGINDEKIDSAFQSTEKQELIDFFRKQLQIQQSRGDYTELIQLALLFLGANERFTIKKTRSNK